MDATHGGKRTIRDIVESSRRPGGFFTSPFLWGAFATAAFYAAIPYLPVHRALVQRYFCGHPMEYLLAGLFFLGMAILLRKAVCTRAEVAALETGVLDDPSLTETDQLLGRAQRLERKAQALPAKLQHTVLLQRIRDACMHVRGRKSAAGLSEHLKYLAEVASDRLHAGYALVRTITWAVPILGFLGTVIGITLAISNLTPEQLDKSLSTVTGGLGIAFDTTALALALSVVLVFTSFLVERSEQRILSRVEDVGTQRIALLFPDTPASGSPLAEAEMHAARTLVQKTDELIARQTELWTETLETTRRNWAETLEAQQHQFHATLGEGMQATLQDHAVQLEATRNEFLIAFRAAADEMHKALAESHAAQRALHESFGERMDGLWNGVRDDLHEMHSRQQQRLEGLTGAVAERVDAWQKQLQHTTETGREQLDELRRQRDVLLQLAGQEDRLARLQQQLTENLQALQATETFEETLHSLSAAVHLLTARARPAAA